MDQYRDFKLKTPATLLISGPSGSGKSSLVQKIIQNLGSVYDNPAKQVIICYSREQPLYDDLRQHSPLPIKFIKGLPKDIKPQARTLLIFDDLQDEFGPTITSFFIKNSHHYDVDVILLCQNLFEKSAHHRTCSLNSSGIIVFKNPRDAAQMGYLARQITPFNPAFLISAYKQATEEPHSYLFINLKQDTPELLRYRDSVFPAISHFYVDKRNRKILQLPI